MKENDRYIKNTDSVRKIADIFGLRLLSFDPYWVFSTKKQNEKIDISPLEIVSQSFLSNYHIPDDFIGKVALLMGLDWSFDEPTESLEKLYEDYKKIYTNIGKDRKNIKSLIKSRLNITNKDNDTVISNNIDELEKTMEILDNYSKEDYFNRMMLIDHELKIRNNIINYKKSKGVD